MSATETTAPKGPAIPKAQATGYVLFILFLVYLFNFVDRQVVNILAEPIKRELGLSDTELGAMNGLGFALFYTVLGLPLARYADRPTTDRPKMIVVCLVIWSGMTALCGTAASFVQLMLYRIGVGVGEAGCSPTAHSLISDLVPREKRARALSLYALGIPLGKLIGMVVGGVVAQIWGWRVAFMMVGLPGLALGAVTWLTMRDPRRDAPPATQAVKGESIWKVLGDLFPNECLWWMSLGGAFMSFLAYGQGAFAGSFFIRVHHMKVASVGVTLGLAFGLAGAIGTWMGGMWADRVVSRNPKAYALLPVMWGAGAAALFVVSMLTPSANLSLWMLAASSLLNSAYYGPMFATVQSIVKPQQKATAAAAHLFIIALIGLGLGPLVFGALSDWFNKGLGYGSAEGLRYALLWGSFPAAILGMITFYLASLTITRRLSEADIKI